MKLQPGLVLAIEPMVSMGSSQIRQAQDDSYYTADGSLSAHFEKTIAITKNGAEILTPF
jgi:methionyl aminopeptidase